MLIVSVNKSQQIRHRATSDLN